MYDEGYKDLLSELHKIDADIDLLYNEDFPEDNEDNKDELLKLFESRERIKNYAKSKGVKLFSSVDFNEYKIGDMIIKSKDL